MGSRNKFWRIAYIALGKWLPESNHMKLALAIRRFFARKILSAMGNNVNIEKGADFNEYCSVGDRSGIGIRCELHAAGEKGRITIGKYVNMGPEVVIYTLNHASDRTDIIMQKQGMTGPEPVTIEDDVWIGRRVIILPGVTIGTGSVIGAGAIVPRNIPPYSVAVGNPARIVRCRK